MRHPSIRVKPAAADGLLRRRRPAGPPPHCPAWCAVALDDTSAYTLADEDRPYLTALWTVYAYDAASVTHCCEATPSRALIYLYTTAITVPDCPDAIRERIDSRYCYLGGDDTYLHVAAVDKLAKAHPERHATMTPGCASCGRGLKPHGEGWRHAYPRRRYTAPCDRQRDPIPEVVDEDAMREYWAGNPPL